HGVLDLDEPRKVAIALSEMDLTYVVLTSVDRDDLADGGAAHFAKTVREIKARRPDMLVEALIPDFQGDLDAVRTVVDAGVDVLDHNLETVERLQAAVRGRRAPRPLVVSGRRVLRREDDPRPPGSEGVRGRPRKTSSASSTSTGPTIRSWSRSSRRISS